MKPCSVCGNDIPASMTVCPFCESPQPGGAAPRGRAGPVVTVNLEKGQPTVERALSTLDMRVGEAKVRGTRVLRVVHGWGSSGAGGAIKQAVGRHVRELERQGAVRAHVPGEHYPDQSTAGRNLLSRYPALERTLKADRANPGITFLEM
jgi:hypothetical protein